MTEEQVAAPRRRRGRPPGSGTGSRSSGGARGTAGTRRRRLKGPELVDSLNQMVSDLIKENRRLKRQLAKAEGQSSGSGGDVVKELRSLQRKVQRAVSGPGTTRRRRAATTTTTRRRRTTAAKADA
jgi:hypothetical protein